MKVVPQSGFDQVVPFPLPWPMSHRQRIFSHSSGSWVAHIYSDQDGCLELVVFENETQVISYKSQPVRILGPGPVYLSAEWSGPNVELILHGVTLLSQDICDGQVCEVLPIQHIPETQSSFDKPDAKTACAFWMDFRKQHYGAEKTKPEKNRQLKTSAEQFIELYRAQQSLIDLNSLILDGHNHLLGHLVTELRALLFWPKLNKDGRISNKYNPLLLRLAGRLDLPLPMYKIPELEEMPDFHEVSHLFEQFPSLFIPKEPSLFKSHPNHKLVDCQDWLSSCILKRNSINQETGEVIRQEFTVKCLIHEAANTLGTAHYDEDVPQMVQLLRELKVLETSQFVAVMLQISEITVNLAGYILHNAVLQGIIPPKDQLA